MVLLKTDMQNHDFSIVRATGDALRRARRIKNEVDPKAGIAGGYVNQSNDICNDERLHVVHVSTWLRLTLSTSAMRWRPLTRFLGAYRYRQYTVPLCLGVRDPGIAELRSMRVV